MSKQVTWQSDRPRPQHYEVAHRALPAITLRPSVDLLALAAQGRLDQALRSTWESVGKRLGKKDRVFPGGLAAEIVDVAQSWALLITFPEALHAAEAHFAAVVPCEPADHRRYLVLERAWTTDGQPSTLLGEWTAGSHVNYGGGPAPERQAFLDSIAALAARPRADAGD